MSLSSERRVGLMFTGTPSVPEMVDVARRAEHNGFESIWVAETRITRDAFVPAAAIAQGTTTIRVGTGIVNVFTRNPVLLATSFLSLHELAPGRTVMGLGSGSETVLSQQGFDYHKPLTRLRTYSDAIGRLLRGESVTLDEGPVRLRDARIEDVVSSDGQALRAYLPQYLAANGPRTLRFVGETADGFLSDVCLPTEVFEEKLEIVHEAAQKAGRSTEDIDIGAVVLCSPHEDVQVARDAVRPVVAMYLGWTGGVGDELGLDPAFVEELKAALDEGGPVAGAALVPDELVDTLTVAGDPATCLDRIDAYRAAGADFVVLAPVETAIDETVRLLAPSDV
ncbi:LLM class flavin-dependent oxidoreductase [Streptomyces sp. NPDC001663]|uniref:LLM class flavin-dependent oxidoreductase n=1 Tax=Streptomyces sp. NPDC001663 TaxID=3364597 RepID=UPI0036C43E62